MRTPKGGSSPGGFLPTCMAILISISMGIWATVVAAMECPLLYHDAEPRSYREQLPSLLTASDQLKV